MTQRIEWQMELYRKKIGVRRLQTMAQVTQEMRRIYVACRNHEFAGGWAAGGTAIRMLERLRSAVAAGPLEERLNRLEEHLNLRDERLPLLNGRGRYDDADDDDRPGASLQ